MLRPLLALVSVCACAHAAPPPPAPVDAWSPVRAALEAAAHDDVQDFGLVVYDANDVKQFEWVHGSITPQTRVAVASASKLAASLVFFELIRQGKLSLHSTTGEVLGWSGLNGTITLEHLLSFTSGLQPNHLCTANPFTTLASCVDRIAAEPLKAPPGTRYDYGSTHLQVAARMAEVVSGQSWNELFSTLISRPLGLSSDVAFFTGPRRSIGRQNPLVAGGLRTSMVEYAALLQLVFHNGHRGELTVGTPALFSAQRREPFPSVEVGTSPAVALGHPFRYGLAAWLECGTPAAGCPVISSPGAFGFTPWLDQEAGYTAVLGMQLSRSEEEKPTAFSMELEQTLQPLIRHALAAQAHVSP